MYDEKSSTIIVLLINYVLPKNIHKLMQILFKIDVESLQIKGV